MTFCIFIIHLFFLIVYWHTLLYYFYIIYVNFNPTTVPWPSQSVTASLTITLNRCSLSVWRISVAHIHRCFLRIYHMCIHRFTVSTCKIISDYFITFLFSPPREILSEQVCKYIYIIYIYIFTYIYTHKVMQKHFLVSHRLDYCNLTIIFFV